MKIARFVLKMVATALTAAALAYCLAAYWDRIVEFFCDAKGKMAAKAKTYCYPSEYDDYADWDME